MKKKALIIGNTDGIGLAVTKRLLANDWDITGISRSESPIKHTAYHHRVADVSHFEYPELLNELLSEGLSDLCIYFVGIGELLDPLDMSHEPEVFDVNLTSMVKTASAVIPQMVKRGQGHFIGVSSLADELISAEAPSYYASKAGFSNYLRGLSLALKPKGVCVTNVRFGFVDTKMAKGDIKPLMMSAERAAEHIEVCIKKRPARYTAPKLVIPLIKFRKVMMKLGAK
ncbi:MAG: SDR family NAD(P)-dependent oxidoreductase [Candidatus Aminicenantes bacterium]|nr:SDR family NAD(P)-dependent oxidoreductase [Candidatus Aminicenantes bacterium]